MVSVHYTGTLQSDGSKFDRFEPGVRESVLRSILHSSRDRPGTFEFQVGVGQVIKGWDQGIVGMKRDELCILRCRCGSRVMTHPPPADYPARSDYAYGASGSPPKIPVSY